MTIAEAIDYAESIIQANRSANSSYISNGALHNHALTASMLLNLASQLKQAQELIAALEARQ